MFYYKPLIGGDSTLILKFNESLKIMSKLRFSLIVYCIILFSCNIKDKAEQEQKKPNIVIIMVDDMGFSDLGCYGGEIETPHLDQLANNGLRFTQFYNTSRCCPTRAALLTGLYQHEAGMGGMTENLGVPSYQGYLNDQCVTIAEALKPAGYYTAISGKWHVGNDPELWPSKRGFDRFYFNRTYFSIK